MVLEIEPRVEGRAIDVVLELGQELERLGAIDVDGQIEIDLAAPRARAQRHVGERVAALARRLDELLGRRAIDDEAEVAPLDHALVLAEGEHDARVEEAVGRLSSAASSSANGTPPTGCPPTRRPVTVRGARSDQP